MNRHPVLGREELASLEVEELERLAVEWRARAWHGDKSAYGAAHALEVELRRRVRTIGLQQLQSEPGHTPRPWWRFWQTGSDNGPPSLT